MLQPQFAAFACAPEQDKTQASMPWVLASKQSKAEMASKHYALTYQAPANTH